MAGALPLFEADSPKAAEDDDAGHVERPTGKSVAPHLTLAHGVEEELEIPGRSGQRAEKVIAQHRSLDNRSDCGSLDRYGLSRGSHAVNMCNDLAAGSLQSRLDDWFIFYAVCLDQRMKELVS